MIRGLFCVLIAAFACACAPSSRVSLPATMSVSPDFSAEDAETIFAAAEAWSTATHGVARLRLYIGDGGVVEVFPGSAGGDNLGNTEFRREPRAHIAIDLVNVAKYAGEKPRNRRLLLEHVAMHELGHAFGLNHEPGGLMDANATFDDTVDEETVRNFCDEYVCPR